MLSYILDLVQLFLLFFNPWNIWEPVIFKPLLKVFPIHFIMVFACFFLDWKMRVVGMGIQPISPPAPRIIRCLLLPDGWLQPPKVLPVTVLFSTQAKSLPSWADFIGSIFYHRAQVKWLHTIVPSVVHPLVFKPMSFISRSSSVLCPLKILCPLKTPSSHNVLGNFSNCQEFFFCRSHILSSCEGVWCHFSSWMSVALLWW